VFQTRLITSLILIAAFLGALFLLPELYWDLLMLAVVCIGAWEWAALARFTPAMRGGFMMLIVISGVLLLPLPQLAATLIWQQQVQIWAIFVAAAFWLFLVPVWMLQHYEQKNVFIMAASGWLVLMPTWLALDGLRRVSPLLVLALMATVWIADSSAYIVGKRFGRRKLAPQISPGKTWEGVVGAFMVVTMYGTMLCLTFDKPWWLVVGLWGLTVLSIIGDLFESLLKRQAGIKDSGTLLPGHGGVLDRIDGLTPTLPLAAFYAYFPLYISAFGVSAIA